VIQKRVNLDGHSLLRVHELSEAGGPITPYLQQLIAGDKALRFKKGDRRGEGEKGNDPERHPRYLKSWHTAILVRKVQWYGLGKTIILYAHPTRSGETPGRQTGSQVKPANRRTSALRWDDGG